MKMICAACRQEVEARKLPNPTCVKCKKNIKYDTYYIFSILRIPELELNGVTSKIWPICTDCVDSIDTLNLKEAMQDIIE